MDPNPVDDPVAPKATVTQENNGESEIYLIAIRAYEAQDDDELTLEEGEMIIKLGEPDSEGWCLGRREDGTEGLFAIDFVIDRLRH